MQLISSRTSSPVDPVHSKILSQQDCSIFDIWHACTKDFLVSLSEDQSLIDQRKYSVKWKFETGKRR